MNNLLGVTSGQLTGAGRDADFLTVALSWLAQKSQPLRIRL